MGKQHLEEHGSVTPLQLTTIMVGAIIGVGVLAFPRIIGEQAETGAPLAALLGAIPPAIAWLAAVKLYRWFPRRTPVEYAPRLLTRPLGWLYSGILILFLVTITGLTVREFGEVVKTAVLPETPLEVTTAVLLLTAVYFVRYDVQVFARVYEVFFPIMVVPLVIIGLLSLKNAKAYYLMPLTGPSWAAVLRGAALASVGYVAMITGIFLLPSLNLPKKAAKAGLWGLGVSAFLYLLVVTASLSVLGPAEMKRVIWPTFELIRSTTVPGFILERLEAAFIGIWVAAVFTTVAATYYSALLAITQLFKLGDHKVAAIPLVPVLYMIAMAPNDIHTLYRILTMTGLAGVMLMMGVMPLLVAVGYLRRKGARRGAGAAQ